MYIYVVYLDQLFKVLIASYGLFCKDCIFPFNRYIESLAIPIFIAVVVIVQLYLYNFEQYIVVRGLSSTEVLYC